MLWPTIKTRFLDMHMYITSALQKTDMKAVGLQLALELLHQKVRWQLLEKVKSKIYAVKEGSDHWSENSNDRGPA